MKLMISQPMKNKNNDEIRDERKNLIQKLTEEGYDVIDTIISENAPPNTDEAIYYLSKSIEFISKVDGVVFMKGWDNARGCRIEHLVAKEYGKFIKEVIE